MSALLTAALGPLPTAAWGHTTVGMRQTAPSSGWRMDFIHASMLVPFVTLTLWALMRACELLYGRPIPTSADV